MGAGRGPQPEAPSCSPLRHKRPRPTTESVLALQAHPAARTRASSCPRSSRRRSDATCSASSPTYARSAITGGQERPRIPNPKLRHHALQALGKRGNIEGAALFATLAPASHRGRTIRALVAFQTAYNYLDALCELPSNDPIANGEQLHQALLTALHPDSEHPDYYAQHPDTGDGGYLATIVERCRSAVTALPSYDAIAPTAREAAGRIVDFQALNLNEHQGGHDALKRWATELTPAQ